MKKNSSFVALVIFLSILTGVLIWEFVMGNADNFKDPLLRHTPKNGNVFGQMYTGGIVVPLLMGISIMVFAFIIERLLSLKKAEGKKDMQAFLVQVEKLLNEGNVDAVIDVCNQQKGTVANIIRSGMDRFKEVRNDPKLSNEQK
jgi:biopolymer transport protein ExbB